MARVLSSLRSLLLRRRSAAEQAALERAVGAVDRELAANLELATMFDQTRQAVVFENGEFARHRVTLEREAPAAYALADDVYQRIPEAEAAMERRGPANSIRDEDRRLVDAWEGDARVLQAALRAAALAPPPSAIARLIARLRAS